MKKNTPAHREFQKDLIAGRSDLAPILPVFLFHCEEDRRFLVITVKSYSWIDPDFQWVPGGMFAEIGEYPLVPCVEFADAMWSFDTEQEALRKQAELYAAQLKGV